MAGGASRDAVSGKSDQAARRKAEGGEAVYNGRGGQASRSIAANAADVDGSGKNQRAGADPTGAHTAVEQRRHRPAEEGGETRSEEHTSELQSRLHLVCRLLLEKKNGTAGP